ncbi:MAG: threonine--tRNA ligase [Bacteroidia bacterium]|nr:MAG: threonine--tRNA ligase [Bacteroidia bacterium]
MINIKLPDNKILSFEHPTDVLSVAKTISSSLAKIALGAEINGQLCDCSYMITCDCNLRIITDKDSEGLEIIRHSAAHLLAQAVKDLYPSAEVTIGPVIDNGYYYDFSFERAFTPEDLAQIEKKMQSLVAQNIPVYRSEMTREEAIAYFKSINEHYKVEIISSIPEGQIISLYTQGNFTDLCRGPHVPSTGRIKAFRLTKVAGAYWRGDSKNAMLQRIYGTAWANKEDLAQYLHMLEEAEKRDHRKIGKQLDLFHQQDEAPGMVFWHPKGYVIWQQIEQYIRTIQNNYGYQEIKTPQILDKSLWEKSGHMDNYAENMFLTASESREYAIKPMNCPCHIQVFNQGLKSYRDLPLRLAEFGSCHRNEPSGSLHGIMRVRNFVQDDAHIFCTDEQIEGETIAFIELVFKVYEKFGFRGVELKLSTRPEQRIGEDSLWDMAELALVNALKKVGVSYVLQEGDGAFYGPKIEFTLKDCLGREWQCGTLQLDFNLPARLGASYVALDGSKKTPVMLHRAALGSIERFIGVLIEHYAGHLPLWLAPIQIMVLNISEKQITYANDVQQQLQQYSLADNSLPHSLVNNNLRVAIDIRNEKIGYKIREHVMQKIPYLVIVGDKEVETATITVRGSNNEDLGMMTIAQFHNLLQKKIAL